MNVKSARKVKILGLIISLILLSGLFTGCETSAGSESSDDTERPEGWTEATHSNSADPDYETVFPEDQVNQITITISPENWEALQSNMTELYGQAGSGTTERQNLPQNRLPGDRQQLPAGVQPRPGAIGGFQPGVVPPDTANLTPGLPALGEDFEPPTDLPQADQQEAVPGWANMASDNPDWVTATVSFDGLEWTDVGFRFKGNSSLANAWRTGSDKLPFKLDFDEFEDDYPEIDNQRFYGFKQLSFSNSFNDPTYMRDALASDLLEDSGLPSAKTAWYEVTLDYGEGQVNLGIYVLTEVIDDTAIDRYFGDDSGNIYEGDGRGVSLAEGTLGLIESSFQKENNEDEADWSDIEELYNVLHSNTRLTDPAQWRQELEEVFNTGSFLEWLAIAGVLQHWDTYGSMTHNFYLYHNEETGQLEWISWDHNETLSGGRNVDGANPRVEAGILPGRTSTLGRDEVTDQWPLIRYLLDDPVYYQDYLDYLAGFVDNVFDPDTLADKLESFATLLAPYVDNISEQAYAQTVDALIAQIQIRYQATLEFLIEEEVQ